MQTLFTCFNAPSSIDIPLSEMQKTQPESEWAGKYFVRNCFDECAYKATINIHILSVNSGNGSKKSVINYIFGIAYNWKIWLIRKQTIKTHFFLVRLGWELTRKGYTEHSEWIGYISYNCIRVNETLFPIAAVNPIYRSHSLFLIVFFFLASPSMDSANFFITASFSI